MGFFDKMTFQGKLPSLEIDKCNFQETETPYELRKLEDRLFPDVNEGFEGIRSILPNLLDECQVLMLGCGTGRDAFMAGALVGARGHVLALDASHEAISSAEARRVAQMVALGANPDALEFGVCSGDTLPFDDASFDVCIVNPLYNRLDSHEQESLVCEALRVLKDGGELALSTVFSNRRHSELAKLNLFLKNNLLAHAPYTEDFRRMLVRLGINNFRFTEKREVTFPEDVREKDPALEDTFEGIHFTYRALRIFKLRDIEDLCENYGQTLEYSGTAPQCPQYFDMDDYHRFFTGRIDHVCGNTFLIATQTRFAPYFKKAGNQDNHFGIYGYCEYCGSGSEGRAVKPAIDAKQSSDHCKTCKYTDNCEHDQPCGI